MKKILLLMVLSLLLTGWSNEKVNSSSSWFDLVFLDLSKFLEDNPYKSTLKSAIIRYTKSVCLHGKQTTGAVWEKINSTRLTSKMKLDLGDWSSSQVVICLLLLWLYRLARVKVWGDNYRLAGRYFCFIKLILRMVNLRHTFHMHYS